MAINFPNNPAPNDTWQDPVTLTNYTWTGVKWSSYGGGLDIGPIGNQGPQGAPGAQGAPGTPAYARELGTVLGGPDFGPSIRGEIA